MATTSPDSKVPTEQEDDKKLLAGYAEAWQSKLVRLAAAELDLTRSKFVVDAAVERAVAVLREKNPSALVGTPVEAAA